MRPTGAVERGIDRPGECPGFLYGLKAIFGTGLGAVLSYLGLDTFF